MEQKHFCRFSVGKYTSKNDYVNVQPTGFLMPRLAIIIKGSCTLHKNDGYMLDVNEGDVWFLPKNQPYVSYWTANGTVEFIFIEFDADLGISSYVDFQAYSDTSLLPLFEELHNFFSSEQKLKAVISFYKILEQVLPKLKKGVKENFKAIKPAIDYINQNYTQNIKVSTLAKLCFLSESRFYNVFKKITNHSPIDYKNNIKIMRAVELLKNGYTLEKICETLNFSSSAFLRSLIKKHSGQTPKQLKKNLPL